MQNRLAKIGFVLTLLTLVSIVFTPSQTSQADNSITYIATTTGSPTFARLDGPWAGLHDCSALTVQPTAEYHYHAQPFTVSESGTYTMDIIRHISGFTDTQFSLYVGNFDPSAPLDNCIWYNEDDGSVTDNDGYEFLSIITANLSADVQYVLVTAEWLEFQHGSYEVKISGTGDACIDVCDGRLNPEMADDTEVVIYPGRDDDGNRTMQAYCVNSEAYGFLGLVISVSDLSETAPMVNTLLLESDICDIEFWVLAEGSEHRYQLNVGPNADGTVTELLFNDLNATDLEMRTFNLYDL